jgi:ABC-type transport system substrate-binding protein
MPIDFKGPAQRLTDMDLSFAGHLIGAGEDEFHAVLEVESSGSGFDKQGRPKMLFEPHVFWRNLRGAEREQAAKQGIAYPAWGTKRYPSDSYPRLAKAIAINETAALKAASWGLGQILGENYKLAGYATPQAMVRAFMDDEECHLEAIVSFLIKKRLAGHLKAHRWDKVALGYNGKSYAKHNYHGRMARAYARWAKIKDTAYAPVPKPKPAKASAKPEKPGEAPAKTGIAALPKKAKALLQSLGIGGGVGGFSFPYLGEQAQLALIILAAVVGIGVGIYLWRQSRNG